MTDHRGLLLPAFSESATEAPLPVQSAGSRPHVRPLADFRQPPGGITAVPVRARRPHAVGNPTFSDPGLRI